MKVSVISEEKLKHQYSISIPAEVIHARTSAKLQEIGKSAKIDGFRPGKAPLAVLKKRYGSRIQGEVLEEQVQVSVTQALRQQKISPAMKPQIKITQYEEGKDLQYEMTVEVLPTFEQIDYAKLTIDRPKAQVGQAEIDEALARFSEQYHEPQDLKESRPAQKGDVAFVDFVGTIDGEEFEGGSGKGIRLALGAGGFLKDFEDGVLGMSKGQEKNITVHFPDTYAAQNLRGKTAIFNVKVNDIKVLVTPPVDDALAKRAGFENLESLQKAVKNHIEGEYAMASRTKAKRHLLDQLAEKFDFDVPQGMIEAEYDNIVRQYRQSQGLPAQQVSEQNIDGDMDAQTRKEFRSIAERRVRLGLVLADLGQKQKINVSDDEIRDAILKEARMYPGHEQQVVGFYQKNPQAAASLSAPILEEKVVDYIFSTAKMKDTSVTREELFRIEEDFENIKTASGEHVHDENCGPDCGHDHHHEGHKPASKKSAKSSGKAKKGESGLSEETAGKKPTSAKKTTK